MQLVKKNKSESILITGINLYIFLLWFFPSSFALFTALLLVVNIVYIVISNDLKIKFTWTVKLWYLFIILQMANLVYTSLTSFDNFVDGMQFILYQVIFLMTYILLVSAHEWTRKFNKYLGIVLAIYFFGSTLQLSNPQLLTTINELHLGRDFIQYYYSFIASGSLVGLTYQTTVNGYILSIFQGFLLINIYQRKSVFVKIFVMIMFIINFYFLFLTGKRALIVFVMLATVGLIFSFMKNKINIILVIITMAIIGWYFLYYTEAGSLILQRMEFLESLGNVTAYRSQYNEKMWKDFLEQPLFGYGTYSTRTTINATNGHNVYLQVLRENGLLGFLIFGVALFGNFIKGYAILFKNLDVESKMMIGFSVYCQIIFILWGATENPLYDVYPLFLYFCTIASMDSIIMSQKDEINDLVDNFQFE